MSDNKWSKPKNPPPPLFLGEKERDLVKQVNDELLERVIGQQILYLPISLERAEFHPLYGEAIEKSFLPPVRVYAMVEFGGFETVTSHYGLDKDSKITVRFHERRLTEDQDLYVREGDYVRYGNYFYEIVTLKEDRQLFGQIDHIFQLEATCIKTRKGLIDIKTLPDATAASRLASSTSSSGDDDDVGAPTSPTPSPPEISGEVVRLTYIYDAPTDIAPGTSLNTYFGIVDPLELSPTALFSNGLRMTLTDNPSTGEYYIIGGNIYNSFEIFSGYRLVLEVLTVV